MTKAGSLYLELREEIVRRQVGERFWSIREIMKRYGVSQLVVDRTVARLRGECLLESQPGRGWYVRECGGDRAFSGQSESDILVMLPRWPAADLDEIERTIEIRNAVGNECKLHSERFDFSTAVPRDLEETTRRLAGLIIQPSSTPFDYRDILAIHTYMSNCRTVILGRHLEEMDIPCIGPDNTFAGHMAAHHLAGHGHRRIGILVSEPHNQVIMSRVRGAQDYSLLHGLDCTVIDCGTRSGEAADGKAYSRFREELASGLSITGLIGVSGDSISGAVNACHNHGVRIPEELSIVAIACEERTATYFPPLDTVTAGVSRQLDLAVDWIIRRPAGICSTSTKTELIRRGSVIDARNSALDRRKGSILQNKPAAEWR